MFNDLFPHLYPADLDLTAAGIVLRLACALLLGIVIGTEREFTNRPAGMRTHMLVALGACVVMIIDELIYLQYSPYGDAPDPARLGAQVVSGVGFLGAGTILREGLTVKGLTTAASLWATACLGLAAGAGYYLVATCGTVFIFVTLTIFELIQRRLFKNHGLSEDYSLTANDVTKALKAIREEGTACGAVLSNIHIKQNHDNHNIIFRASFPGPHAEDKVFALLSRLAASDGISAAETTSIISGVPVK